MGVISFYNSIYLVILVCDAINCHSDSESSESNRIEVTPFYDTIIYSDIADIINDFENNGIPPFDMVANSESQSDDKVEDLLTEYQHYLEKAHKQRKNYLEKSHVKNKVPAVRHDQFTKTKPGSDFKRNDYYLNGFFNTGNFKLPQTSFSNPLDIFIPINSKGQYQNKPEMTTIVPKLRGDPRSYEKLIYNNKKILDLPPLLRKSPFEAIKSPCYCMNGQFPCDCNNCKQCLIHMPPYVREQSLKVQSPGGHKNNNLQSPLTFDNYIKYDPVNIDETMKDTTENAINIHIKVDLQLPKVQDFLGKLFKTQNHEKTTELDNVNSKELTTAIKIPFPYFNMPLPMNMFGYKKSYNFKEDSTPIHKITFHKKKKPKPNNNNKKHRKKIITFHNIKLGQQPLNPIHTDENITETHIMYNNRSTIGNNDTTDRPDNGMELKINSTLNKTYDIINDTQTEGSIYLMVNISNDSYSTTEDTHKMENSIETDIPNTPTNVTTKLPFVRKKRDVVYVNISASNSSTEKVIGLVNVTNNIIKENNSAKKSDKNFLTDTELLYWPNNGQTVSYITKNITSIILEKENTKTKLNLSTELIRKNHTKALEQAIFGDVNWDDIDTVAPAFMSFVGKYLRGILTFCSQKVCHSMKCANETCLHRVCVPAERLNNKGHCAGSNRTDSIASMESLMDLPSNIAFETVDILQSKMLGKIFGKATLCINSKCITLVASKKTFVKFRCSLKELNTTGHCSNAKTLKTI